MTRDEPAFERLLAAANRAPSAHNTQPWRFRLRAGAIELLADYTRHLPVVDPRGRELTLACGAALYNLRLAVIDHGFRPDVELLPEADEPDLLARVRFGPPVTRRRDDAVLFRMIYRRYTHRSGFEDRTIPRGQLLQLAAAAAAEGADLRFVERPSESRELMRLVALADRQQRQNPAYDAELRAWTRPRATRLRDGVPATAFPLSPADDPLTARDFDLGRGWGVAPTEASDASTTVVLATEADRPRDWLAAAQAMQRVLLQAASQWVFAQFHTQAMEVPHIRAEVGERLRLIGVPQMLMRLGYARSTTLTPRRPALETLVG